MVDDSDAGERFNEVPEYFQGIISLKPGAESTKAEITKGIGLANILDNANTRYWIANQNTNVREGRAIRIRVKRDRTEFEARTIYGCIEPTGPHGSGGHAGMRATGNDAGTSGQDVYITTRDNPATVCNDSARNNERARPAWFQSVGDSARQSLGAHDDAKPHGWVYASPAGKGRRKGGGSTFRIRSRRAIGYCRTLGNAAITARNSAP